MSIFFAALRLYRLHVMRGLQHVDTLRITNKDTAAHILRHAGGHDIEKGTLLPHGEVPKASRKAHSAIDPSPLARTCECTAKFELLC